MIFSGELPYDVGYPKKHIRPYGGSWGLLLYPAQQSPCWLNSKIGVFYLIFYFMSSDMFSIIVSYQNEHLQNIIVYCWHFPHPAPVLHWWLKIDPKWPKKPEKKIVKILLKNDNLWKQMSIPPFLGNVGLIKVVFVFILGTRSTIFCTQKWALLPKVPISSAQKWHFGCPNKFWDHFYNSNIPQ